MYTVLYQKVLWAIPSHFSPLQTSCCQSKHGVEAEVHHPSSYYLSYGLFPFVVHGKHRVLGGLRVGLPIGP